MTKDLDLADIQGNIIRAYGKFGYPKARYIFLNIRDADAGRRFCNLLFPQITSALRWTTPGSDKKVGDYPGEERVPQPDVTVNIGFSYKGLQALGLPVRSLKSLPQEFIEGMRERADVLKDVAKSSPMYWDDIWKNNHGDTEVHVWISINGLMDMKKYMTEGKVVSKVSLDKKSKEIEAMAKKCLAPDGKPGVAILKGHGPKKAKWQDASGIVVKQDGKEKLTPAEHFGYRDGIGDPVFEGQFSDEVEAVRVVGRGKIAPQSSEQYAAGTPGDWQPLATGEFLLGHPDESQEVTDAIIPFILARNGTFMAYRKLHENVGSFNTYTKKQAETYANVTGMEVDEAHQTLKAKMVGRWTDGTPLVKAATVAERDAFRKSYETDLADAKAKGDKKKVAKVLQRETDFRYGEDVGGIKCPYSAHMRRANVRDMLDPAVNMAKPNTKPTPVAGNGSALNKRRRILRRGLPYGESKPGTTRDDGEHGIIFMAVCSNLFRQFEFVQQQWIQYGLDFNAGNDTCPVIGLHEKGAKLVIPADPEGETPAFIAHDIPPLVETRGGEYFFIPSLSALRMIAMGIVDPT